MRDILLACRGDEIALQNQKMIATLTRGGLWCITENFQRILEDVELNFRKFMHHHKNIVNIDKFVADMTQLERVTTLYDAIISY